MQRAVARFFLCGVGLLSSVAPVSPTTPTNWPIEPTQQDHSLMSTFEFKHSGRGQYVHAGVDIVAPEVALARPIVRTTIAGELVCVTTDSSDENGNGITVVVRAGGNYYRYAHIDRLTLKRPFDFVTSCNVYNPPLTGRFQTVAADAMIGRVMARLDACPPITPPRDWSHLHYEIEEISTNRFQMPLLGLNYFWDSDQPAIESLALCDDDASMTASGTPAWQNCISPARPCQIVRGKKDIIAKVRDWERSAGAPPVIADSLAPRRVDYAICDESNPGCASTKTALDLESMPDDWLTEAQNGAWTYYSIRSPYVSQGYNADGWKCADDDFFIVPTNDNNRVVERKGAWDTTASPDGFYSLTVSATDYAQPGPGNSMTTTVPICVDNDGTCQGKLVVRDCDADTGGEPSECTDWWSSPDMTVLSTGSGLGSSTTGVRVCMWNDGCGSIDADTTINVAVDWAPPSSDNPYPLPAGVGGVIGSVQFPASGLDLPDGTAAPASAWAPGEVRCVTVPWPTAGTAPSSSHYCLIGRVWMTGDAVGTTSSVRLDNNRAQHNVMVLFPIRSPHKVPPIVHVYPLDEFMDRHLEIRFRPRGVDPRAIVGQISIGPGAEIERWNGTALIGEVTPDAYDALRLEAPLRWSDEAVADGREGCAASAERQPRGCWKISGEFTPAGTISLDGLVIGEAAPLSLGLWSIGDGPGEGVLDIEIREFGRRRGDAWMREMEIGSLLIRVVY